MQRRHQHLLTEKKAARLYGRARGRRLRSHQAELVKTLLPLISVPGETGVLDAEILFGKKQPLWLEIGFGGGEHLIAQADALPEIGLIGCEPFLNGVASLLSEIEPRRADNQPDTIRLFMGDAHDLLDRLAPASLDRVFLLFPDPWTKRRHNKRRFVSMASLNSLARVLKPGAEFHFATDISDYCQWTLHHVNAHRAFERTEQGVADWSGAPADWPGTRYEEKARKAGRNCVYLRFRRTNAEV